MSDIPSTQVRSFHLDAPLARVFPFFTALGEKAWAQGWEPEILSGREERGSVFRTVHDGRETTWIVVDYAPSEGRVSYARLAHGSNMGLVDVQCTAVPGGGTEVSVRYTLTGLNAQGQAFVGEFLQPGHYTDDRGMACFHHRRIGGREVGISARLPEDNARSARSPGARTNPSSGAARSLGP